MMAKQNAISAANLAEYDSLASNAGAESSEFLMAKNRAKAILEVLAKIPDRRIIADIGCSTGALTQHFFIDGVEEIHGFDLSLPSLKSAALRGIVTHQWDANAGPPPFRSRIFDVVIAAEVIEHIVDTDDFVEYLKGFTKPKGHMIITTPNLHYWLSRINFVLGRQPYSHPGVSSVVRDKRADHKHVRIGNLSSWFRFFQLHSLAVLSVRGISRVFPKRNLLERLLTLAEWVSAKRPQLAAQLIFDLQVIDDISSDVSQSDTQVLQKSQTS